MVIVQTTLATTYHRWMRWQYQLNRRLRRGAVALAVVFMLGVFCPFACAIHCALIDMIYGSAAMAGHHHGGHAGQAAPTMCQLMGEGGDPAHMPLAPAFYELAPLGALAHWLPALALLGALSIFAAPWSSQRTRPPLRPPRHLESPALPVLSGGDAVSHRPASLCP